MKKDTGSSNGTGDQKAKTLSESRSSESPAYSKETDNLKKIHELEVRLKELENQNRELRSANESTEKMFRSVIDNVSSGVALIDEAGRFSVYNALFLKLFELSEDSTIKNINDQDWGQWQVFNEDGKLLHVDDHPVRKAALTGKKVNNQLVGVKSPFGKKLTWMLISAEPVFKANGEIDLIICTYNDITEVKKTEAELRKNEANLFGILNATRESIWMFSVDGRILLGNRIAMERMDKPSEMIIGQYFRDILPKDLAESRMAQLQETIRTGLPRIFEDWRAGICFEHSFYPVIDSTREINRVVSFSRDITEHKKAEEALQIIHAKLKAALDSMTDAVFISDTEGNFIHFNDAFATFHKFANRDECAKTFAEYPYILDVYFPDGTHAPTEMWAVPRALRGETVSNAEYSLRRKDTGETWIGSYNFSPIYDNAGVITGSVVVGRDITELKKSEKTLKESEQRYRLLSETMLQGVVHQDSSGKIIAMNPAAEYILGKSPDQFLGSSSVGEEYNTIREDGSPFPGMEHPAMVALRTGQPVRDVVMGVFNPRIQEYRWISIDAIPVRYSPDEHSSEVYTVFGDITERKKAEEALRDSEQALKRAQEKLNIALENGNIGVWEWDLKTNEIIWDIRMEKMFGLEPGTFGRKYKAFENLVNEEDLHHIQRAVNDALEKDIPLETVYRTISQNGEMKYISAKAMLIKDKNGKPLGMTGVCFDITGMKKGAEQVLIKLNEELLRSNKDLEHFAYVASHDLQEPLRMVSNFTQLLARRYKDVLDQEAQEYINFTLDGTNRMYELINGLLAYSRIQNKGKELKEVNMNTVMDTVIRNLRTKIHERNAVITIDKLTDLEADEGQMVQLMQNLVGNAIKFSPEQPKIYISSKTEENQVTFSVRDEGIGIEPQYFDRIFQMFQRLVSREHYEGTGIGLAICKRIIDRHDGNIWVESEPGKGTTFYFTIPMQAQRQVVF